MSLLTIGASAGIIRIDYSGTAQSGPLNGQNFSGFFTFDMSLIRPRGGIAISLDRSPGLELDSEFTLGSLAFNDTDSALTLITFNSAGEVNGFAQGGNIGGQGRVNAGIAD